jgi:hypothetical protein
LSVKADQPTPTTWQITMHRGELFAHPSLVVDGHRYRPRDGRRPGTFRISRGTNGIRFDWLQPDGPPRIPRRRSIVWAEPRSQKTTITTSRKQILQAARNGDANTPLTLHAVLPRDVLTSVDGVNVEPKPGLAAILDVRRGDDSAWWSWALAAVAAIAVSAGVFRTARSRRPLRR